MTVNALAAAGDVLIAAILCSILQMSRTGFKRFVPGLFALFDLSMIVCNRSDTMIKKLVRAFRDPYILL